MQHKRSVRVAEFLKREVSKILMEDIKDPEIEFVTITSVTVSPDLKYAKIFYTVIGDYDSRDRVDVRLQAATKFIRNKIGKVIEFRHVPEIKFSYDTLADHVANMEKLFLKIKKENEN